jgi:hypothetical protein
MTPHSCTREVKSQVLAINPTFEKESRTTKILWWRMLAVVWREVGGKSYSGAVRATFSRAE